MMTTIQIAGLQIFEISKARSTRRGRRDRPAATLRIYDAGLISQDS